MKSIIIWSEFTCPLSIVLAALLTEAGLLPFPPREVEGAGGLLRAPRGQPPGQRQTQALATGAAALGQTRCPRGHPAQTSCVEGHGGTVQEQGRGHAAVSSSFSVASSLSS